MAGHIEVSGSDEQLYHLIDSGEIEAPCLVGFNDWLIWRSGAGMRPKKNVDGVFITQKQGALLWRATMAANHGEEWMIDLAAQTAGDPEADEDQEEEATASEVPALQASPTGRFSIPRGSREVSQSWLRSLRTSHFERWNARHTRLLEERCPMHSWNSRTKDQ